MFIPLSVTTWAGANPHPCPAVTVQAPVTVPARFKAVVKARKFGQFSQEMWNRHELNTNKDRM
jgi:hypothetical protein